MLVMRAGFTFEATEKTENRMGISKAAANFLISRAEMEAFEGRILTLGVMQTTVTSDQLERIADERSFQLQPAKDTSFNSDGCLTDIHLLQRLGFSEVVRTDVSDYQNPDFLMDLNTRDVPNDYRGTMDVVLDSGTTEHVFNVPNVLANIFDFLKIGGRVIHLSPSANMIDHGFYQFCPTLFWDYYTTNEFELPTIKLYEYNKWGNIQDWVAGDYQPGFLKHVASGGLPRARQYGVAVCAKRTQASTCDRIPQQSKYTDRWADPNKVKKPPTSLSKRLKRIWKSNRVRGFPLKVTDRY